MKRIIDDTEPEGLLKLIGERVTFYCLNYIWTGDLVGVNDTCVLLKNPAIVYETGPYTEKTWKDAQSLPQDFYLMLSAIEGFGKLK